MRTPFIIALLLVLGSRLGAQCVNPTIPTVTNATICTGNTVTLTASGTLNDATDWYWYTGSCGQNFVGTGSSIVVSPILSTTYFVRGEGSCVTPAGCASATVLVNPDPVISVNSATICTGDTTTLMATGANTYSWIPSVGLSSTTGYSVNVSLPAGVTYSVIGTDLNGCSDTVTTSVAVNPLPAVFISPQNASGCVPLCINFTNASMGSGVCSWDFGNGSTSISCSSNMCYTSAGTYNSVLTLTDNNGCVGTSAATVNVYPVPTADFSATQQSGTCVNFVDLTNGATISSWHWAFGDSNVSSVSNPNYCYQDTGTYFVQLVVVSMHGCADSITKSVSVVSPNAINKFTLHPELSLYPNPCSDVVNIHLTDGFKPDNMMLFSSSGKNVYSGKYQKTFDVSTLPEGTYLLILPHGKTSIRRAFEIRK